MAKLSEDEKKLLEELTAKANAEDEEDFEIEVYDSSKGKGARIPFSKGRAWLFSEFGIGDDPNPKTEEDKDKPRKKTAREDPEGGANVVRHGYFGKQAG